MYFGGLRYKGMQTLGIGLLLNLLFSNQGLPYIKHDSSIQKGTGDIEYAETRKNASVFRSEKGGYSIPLDVAEITVKDIPESELEKKVLNETLIKNSKNDKWTYLPNEKRINKDAKEVGYEESGTEDFMRLYGDRMARITVTWRPIMAGIKEEHSAIKEFFGINAKVVGELEVKINGYRGLGCRFITEAPEGKIYTNYIVLHHTNRGYEISVASTEGFDRLEGLLEKIKGIEFNK